MPNGHLNFFEPRSLAQTLVLNILEKCHVFPGGKISGQTLDIRARNITIEVAGSLVAKSKSFTRGSGTGRFIESILL